MTVWFEIFVCDLHYHLSYCHLVNVSACFTLCHHAYFVYDRFCYGQLLEWLYFLDICTSLYVFPSRTCLIYGGPLYLHIRSLFLFPFARS